MNIHNFTRRLQYCQLVSSRHIRWRHWTSLSYPKRAQSHAPFLHPIASPSSPLPHIHPVEPSKTETAEVCNSCAPSQQSRQSDHTFKQSDHTFKQSDHVSVDNTSKLCELPSDYEESNNCTSPSGQTSSSPSSERSTDRSATLSQLWSVLSPEKLRLKLALGALVVSSCATLSMPKLLGLLVDKFGVATISGGSGAAVGLYGGSGAAVGSAAAELGLQLVASQSGIVVGAIFIGALASGLRLFLLESASERIAYRLRVRLFESLLSKKIEVFDQLRTGEQINRLSAACNTTARVLLDISFGLRNILTAVVGTSVIFTIVPAQLVAVLVAPVAGIFVFGVAYGKFVRKLAQQKQDRMSDAASRAEEKLSGIRTVRLFNGEAFEAEEFRKEMDKVYNVGFISSLAAGGRSAIFYSAGGSLLLHLIYRCGVLIASGSVSLGDVTSLVLYVMMTGASYQGVIAAYGDIQKALGSCNKVMELIYDNSNEEKTYRKPEEKIISSKVKNSEIAPRIATPAICGSIKFDNIWFSYPSRPEQQILRGFSLEIPENSSVAILGESGSGKSTLSALLMRLYEPSMGSIKLGGVDIGDHPPSWVRSQIGVVNQEPTLFAMTIRQNILYGWMAHRTLMKQQKEDLGQTGSSTLAQNSSWRSRNGTLKSENHLWDIIKSGGNSDPSSPDVDDFKLSEVDWNHLLEISHSSDFINEFPDGLETVVGEKGATLSGGQKQRICLARALARQPKFMVLDEATSALDTRSEQIVHEALAEMMRKSTTLIITHRLSTLHYADYVAVLGSGKLAQFGTRADVLNSPGLELQRILSSQSTQ